jgi:hypothetical protein
MIEQHSIDSLHVKVSEGMTVALKHQTWSGRMHGPGSMSWLAL